MGAQEQHGGLAVGDLALDPGQGVEALAGEPFGQQGQEVGDGCAPGELVVGGVQEPFDRFHPEVPSKSRCSRVAAVLQGEPVDRWTDRGADGGVGRGFRSWRTPVFGIEHWWRCCEVVGDDDVVGGGGGVGVEGGDQRQPDERADDLGDDEAGR